MMLFPLCFGKNFLYYETYTSSANTTMVGMYDREAKCLRRDENSSRIYVQHCACILVCVLKAQCLYDRNVQHDAIDPVLSFFSSSRAPKRPRGDAPAHGYEREQTYLDKKKAANFPISGHCGQRVSTSISRHSPEAAFFPSVFSPLEKARNEKGL